MQFAEPLKFYVFSIYFYFFTAFGCMTGFFSTLGDSNENIPIGKIIFVEAENCTVGPSNSDNTIQPSQAFNKGTTYRNLTVATHNTSHVKQSAWIIVKVSLLYSDLSPGGCQ